MVIAQGDVWWADLSEPHGSEAGYRRPVVVVQGDSLNQSGIATVVCLPLTSNTKWAIGQGNVLLGADETGLPRDSVAHVAQILAVNKTQLSEWVTRLRPQTVRRLLAGIDVMLGR